MRIKIIDTGYFYADGGAMFGAIPKSAWSRRYPSDEGNGCVLAMRTLLVESDDGHIIVVDNGCGNKQLKELSYYRFFNMCDLGEELKKFGVMEEDVTDVVLTHLHFDHCGYTTKMVDGSTTPQLSFPNAKHWVGRPQWENFLNPNPLEKDSYFIENMQAASDNGSLRLVDRDMQLCQGVKLRLFDGHTPGQIVPYMKGDDRGFIFAGDVIPLVASLSPGWISAYDTYPVTSYSEKVRLLEEAANDKWAIIYCHDAYTRCSTVKKVNSYYKKGEAINDLLL